MTAHPRLSAAAKKHLLARLLGSAVLACALFVLPAPALAVNDDAVLKRMDAVLEENARLRDEAWKARKNGRDAAKQAEDALNASDERLERTRTEALAHVAGVSPAQVESLRRDGRSWGQAAGELGVHPGFLGIGKAPLYEPKRKAVAEAPQGGTVKGKRGKKEQAKAEPKAKAAGKKSADKKMADRKAPAKAEPKAQAKSKVPAKAAPKAQARDGKKPKKPKADG